MLLLITYDLHKPVQEYHQLHEEIKKCGTWWWHHLDSTWIIQTTQAPQAVYNRLTPHLDADDFILIIELKRNYWGFLPKRAWDWLRERFNEDGG